LRKLLNDQLKTQSKKNLVQPRLFSDMLQKTIQKYQNRSLDTAEIIADGQEHARGPEPGRQGQDER
jgi:type I restriction enzyme, R subunit